MLCLLCYYIIVIITGMITITSTMITTVYMYVMLLYYHIVIITGMITITITIVTTAYHC